MSKIGWMCAALAVVLLVPLGACGGSGGGGFGGGTITVVGVVVDSAGAPRSLVPVVVAGTLTATDQVGEFVVAGVVPPYEVVLLDPVAPYATVYQGLTRADPRLPMVREWREHHADLTATLTGGAGYPLPANHSSDIAFGGPDNFNCRGFVFASDGVVEANSEVTPGNFPGSSYPTGPSWSGSINNAFSYMALQWSQDVNGKVVSFTGQRSGVATVTAGAPTALGPIALGPIGMHEVVGTYSIPPGYMLEDLNLYVEQGPFLSFELPGDPLAAGGNYAARAPLLPSAEFTAEVEARLGNKFTVARTTVPANTTPPILDAQLVNDLLSPADSATGIDHDTVFTFTPSGFGVHMFQITRSGQPNYFIVTAGTQVKIPDLRAYGVTLPANTLLFWSVRSSGPYSTVDELAGEGSFTAPTAVSYFTRTETRPFTTAP